MGQRKRKAILFPVGTNTFQTAEQTSSAEQTSDQAARALIALPRSTTLSEIARHCPLSNNDWRELAALYIRAFLPLHEIEPSHHARASDIVRALTMALEKFQGDAVRLHFWRMVLMYGITQCLEADDLKSLTAFTTSTLRLPKSHVYAVSQALFQRRWLTTDDPLAYVAQTARYIYLEHYSEFSHIDRRFPLKQCFDLESATTDSTAALLPRDRRFDEIDVGWDLYRALRRARLPKDVIILAQGLYEGVPPEKTGADLNWTLKRTAAARKRFDRSRDRLKRLLAPYNPNAYPFVELQPRDRMGRYLR